VLQSMCLYLAIGAPWYVSKRQLHEDLSVPFFADHIRALTESFDSKLAEVWNPPVRNSADTYADRGLTPSPDAKPRAAAGSTPVEDIARDGQVDQTNRVRISRAPFGYPD